jgi:hypothetical protein
LWLNKSNKKYYESGSVADYNNDDVPLGTPDLDTGRVTEKDVAPDLSVKEEIIAAEDNNEPAGPRGGRSSPNTQHLATERNVTAQWIF